MENCKVVSLHLRGNRLDMIAEIVVALKKFRDRIEKKLEAVCEDEADLTSLFRETCYELIQPGTAGSRKSCLHANCSTFKHVFGGKDISDPFKESPITAVRCPSPADTTHTVKLHHHNLKNNRDCHNRDEQLVLVKACENIPLLQLPGIEFIKNLAEYKSVEDQGGFFMSSSVGRSVASARAPKVSIIRFTHNSCTAVRGTSPAETAAMKLITRAATFTFRKTAPSTTSSMLISFVWSIPHSVAMAFAVKMLSPQGEAIFFKLWPGICIVIILGFNFLFLHLLVSKGNASQTTSCHALNYFLDLRLYFFIHCPCNSRFIIVSICRRLQLCLTSSASICKSRTAQDRIAFSVGLPLDSGTDPAMGLETLPVVVSVPVLSVQMTVAEPIVSHAEKYASVSVTASGKPSGIATTTMCHELWSSSSRPKPYSCPQMSQASEHIHPPPLSQKAKRGSEQDQLRHDRFLLSCSIHRLAENAHLGTAHQNTTSPTTRSNIDTCDLLPSLTTSIWILLLIFDNLSNCFSCLKLLNAETATTRKTATNMLPPSYQPSAAPSSWMPKPRDRAAQTSRMRMVVSLKAS
ncbi:hypothetical protein RJ641_031084 [Dillenia turbinata]|uniref:Uncharacterized protein n=1 Tax=Dillenia turbinata TaxID=194707 RepID=A0AAN8ZGV6_9MAGN